MGSAIPCPIVTPAVASIVLVVGIESGSPKATKGRAGSRLRNAITTLAPEGYVATSPKIEGRMRTPKTGFSPGSILSALGVHARAVLRRHDEFVKGSKLVVWKRFLDQCDE